jgi:23S rRNA (uracil1939-C5)-methyltransferase
MLRELTVTHLSNQGDGIAETEGGPVYIPSVLPGERIIADVEGSRGRLGSIEEAAPERIAPICRHFGECGGCALQHLDRQPYLDWKRSRVVNALSMEGIDAPVEPVLAFGAHTRRRATFSALRAKGAPLLLGFRKAQSHDLIDIGQCPVLLSRIEAALPGLRLLLDDLLPAGEARILVTACESGFDLNIETAENALRPLTPAIAHAAEALGIVRITLGDDPVLTTATPRVTCGGVPVDLPPRAFLQASAEAEAAMAAIAVEALGKAGTVADLFCGVGAFSFALARKAAVTAVEIDRRLIAALERAARHAQGLKPVRTLVRDLMREPLSRPELKDFDAVLFDPPRAGAIAQARALAKSEVPVVIAVSCNPASFAKDARALIDGGYALGRVVPIDQFTYSPHVELVAVFERAARRRKSRNFRAEP